MPLTVTTVPPDVGPPVGLSPVSVGAGKPLLKPIVRSYSVAVGAGSLVGEGDGGGDARRRLRALNGGWNDDDFGRIRAAAQHGADILEGGAGGRGWAVGDDQRRRGQHLAA